MREQIHDAHQTCNYVDLFKSVPQMDVISEMLNLITIICHETIKTILYDNYRPIGAAVTIAPQFRTRNDNSATGVTSQKIQRRRKYIRQSSGMEMYENRMRHRGNWKIN
jgi:hypothetical protein